MNTTFTAKIDSLSYFEQSNYSLEDITLDFKSGELVFLAGSPGCGKSSLCKVLAGVIPHFKEAKLIGKIHLSGKRIIKEHLPEVAGKIGYIIDDPQSQLFSTTVEEDLAFGPCSLLLEPSEVKNRIKKYLEFVGLTGYEKRRTETLSGGEAQRIALASVLTLDPKVIILDQSLVQLDPEGRLEIYTKLRKLVETENKILIIVEEQSEKYLQLADRLIVLDKGKIRYDGTPQREALQYKYTPVHTKPIINHNLNCNTPRIQVNELYFQYPDGEFALSNLSLKVYHGEFIVLLGKNGAGKTTLVKHFNGLHKPGGGDVITNGMNTRNHSTAQLSAQVGYLFQNPKIQICTSTVEDEVAFALKVKGIPKKEIKEKVSSMLSLMGLTQYSKDHPYTLEKGNVQKLALASSLISEPQILIVDEPTSQMSNDEGWEIMEIISKYNQQGMIVIMISHDLNLALHYASRMIVLKQGEIALDIQRNCCYDNVDELFQLGFDIKEVNREREMTNEAASGV